MPVDPPGRRLGEWHAFGDHLAEQGLLRPPKPPHTLRDLNIAVWLIAEGWLPFLEATGDPLDDRQMERGVDLVLVVLESHLTAKGRRAFQRARESSGAGRKERTTTWSSCGSHAPTTRHASVI